MSDRPPPGGSRISAERFRDLYRHRYRTAFWISIGVSAVLHVLIVFLYPTLFQTLPAGVLPYGTSAPPATPQGTELINLEEIPPPRETEAPAPREVEPEPEPEAAPAQAAPSQTETVPAPEEPTTARPGMTAAESLRPREGDLRVWAPLNPELHELSEEEVLRLQLLAGIEAAADSAATEEERAARLRDWTYTDSKGRKWGITPGQLHLGDLTLPFPFSLASKGPNSDREWEWDQIQGAAARGDILRSWKERDKAIRERMNAQRKPDTTGIRK